MPATEAWIDGHGNHAPVGSYARGRKPFGPFDVQGNVCERCRDPYGDETESRPADIHGDRPHATLDGRLRADRGGSWLELARLGRVASRNGHAPAYRVDSLGARPARVVTGIAAK